jgi:hypothetical protein
LLLGEKFPIVLQCHFPSESSVQLFFIMYIFRRLHSRRVIALCGFRTFSYMFVNFSARKMQIIPGNRKFQELLKVDNVVFQQIVMTISRFSNFFLSVLFSHQKKISTLKNVHKPLPLNNDCELPTQMERLNEIV